MRRERAAAIALRKQGKTYDEIRRKLGASLPQSTLSYWMKNAEFSPKEKSLIQRRQLEKISVAQKKSVAVNHARYQKKIDRFAELANKLVEKVGDKDTAKIVLATLYLGEGAKTLRGSLMLGNSNPEIISLFLKLLRFVYPVDENRLRCTVQCRADQNIPSLEKFWSKTTKIPSARFYKTRIDPRTIGQRSRKPGYKGVCRIDYFSADVYNELKLLGKALATKT